MAVRFLETATFLSKLDESLSLSSVLIAFLDFNSDCSSLLHYVRRMRLTTSTKIRRCHPHYVEPVRTQIYLMISKVLGVISAYIPDLSVNFSLFG